MTAYDSAWDPVVEMPCTACGRDFDIPFQLSQGVRCPACGRSFALDDGVLILDQVEAEDDQPDEYYSLLAEAEQRHFWFTERNRLIVSTLRESVGSLVRRTVLDVGCGTGFVLQACERAGASVCGLDVQMAGLRYARRRTHGLVFRGTGDAIPFRGQFDIVLLCDVIEHVSDDIAVLRAAAAACRPDGILLITVPAHMGLWSPVDDISGHKRRYSRATLLDAIQQAGLNPRTVRYFNTLLLPAQFAQRQLLRGHPITSPRDRWRLAKATTDVPREPLNTIMGWAMAADLVLSRLPVTFGSSILALASPADPVKQSTASTRTMAVTHD